VTSVPYPFYSQMAKVQLRNYLKTLTLGYHRRCSPKRGDDDERAHDAPRSEAAPHDLACAGRVVGGDRADLKGARPPKNTGRRRIDQRAALDAIIFRLRTGCQWNRIPEEFPDDSSVHRTFQRWVEKDILDRIWGALIEECEELGGVRWEWQAADGAMGKARFGGTS
jgi:transposase